MINPCINCQKDGIRHIDRKVLMGIAHKFFKITLRNGKEIIVCSHHFGQTRIFDTLKIENSRLVFYPNGRR